MTKTIHKSSIGWRGSVFKVRCWMMSVVVLSLLFSGCLRSKPSPVPPTALEIRQMQVRQYDKEIAIVFSSVVSVFQDKGYIIQEADKNSGFIKAYTPVKSRSIPGLIGLLLKPGGVHRTKWITQTHIERIGSRTSVRIAIVHSSTENYQGQHEIEEFPILDSKVYQSLFEDLEQAIFLRQAAE